MNVALRASGQIIAYAAFAALIGYCSQSPAYRYSPPDRAVVKVSLSHATQRVEPCERLSPEEIARLAPNMRRDLQCKRERLPLTFELAVDGETVLNLEQPPSGLWRDGPALVYRRFELPPGRHRLGARLRDSARTAGWDYSGEAEVSLEAGRYFTITFRPTTGEFVFR